MVTWSDWFFRARWRGILSGARSARTGELTTTAACAARREQRCDAGACWLLVCAHSMGVFQTSSWTLPVRPVFIRGPLATMSLQFCPAPITVCPHVPCAAHHSALGSVVFSPPCIAVMDFSHLQGGAKVKSAFLRCCSVSGCGGAEGAQQPVSPCMQAQACSASKLK